MLFGCKLTSMWSQFMALLPVIHFQVTAFNVDVGSRTKVYNGPTDSYFGFSVGLLSNAEGQWLLVGAPRAESTFPFLKDVEKPGALYKCRIEGGRNTSCQQIKVENEGNLAYVGRYGYIHRKDNRFLGVALDCQPEEDGGKVIVCAHLWKDVQYHRHYSHYLANGICYVLNNTLWVSSARELRPLTVADRQSVDLGHKLGGLVWHFAFGQVGVSAHFSKQNGTFLLGAPGVNDWRGAVVEFSLQNSVYKPDQPGSGFKYDVRRPPWKGLDAEWLVGYSVSSGVFFYHGRVMGVVGAPRVDNRGEVYIYDHLGPGLHTYDRHLHTKEMNVVKKKKVPTATLR